MKYYKLIISSALIISACSTSDKELNNLRIFGTRFSQQSLENQESNQAVLSIFIEEQSSLGEEDQTKKKWLDEHIIKLKKVESQANKVQDLIYHNEIALLNSIDVKVLDKANGISNHSKNTKNITFNFTELNIENHDGDRVDLTEIQTSIDAFNKSLNQIFKNDATSFLEFLNNENKIYGFESAAYTAGNSVLENLVLLEEIECSFNNYYHSLLQEYTRFTTSQMNGSFTFNHIQEVFITESKEVLPGEIFTAKVMLVSSDDQFNKIQVKPNQGEVISIENGIATIRYKAPKSGTFDMSGKITIKNKNGVQYSRDFSEKISVKNK
jgi:hypothetical protein